MLGYLVNKKLFFSSQYERDASLKGVPTNLLGLLPGVSMARSMCVVSHSDSFVFCQSHSDPSVPF